MMTDEELDELLNEYPEDGEDDYFDEAGFEEAMAREALKEEEEEAE